MPSLQSQFLLSKGKPIKIADQNVVLLDKLPLTDGTITIHFISRQGEGLQGVALKSAKGFVKLSDGSKVPRVNVWDEKDLSRTVRHVVSCPDGELRLWNIYKATSDQDRTKSDAWTNNAGMIIEKLSDSHRRYRCSDGIGGFAPDDLVFEIEFLK